MRTVIALCLLPLALASCSSNPKPTSGATPARAPRFEVVETSIAQIHAAFRAKTLTCAALVDAYLARIAAYDKQGPALNAVVIVNPDATKQAADMDRRFAQGGLTGPLHCIPMVVKDNFETIGLQSADGSKSLEGFVSDKDAFLVAKIKAAGAIVIAKTNMAEFAFSPYETLSSIQGHTKNPYALDRVPAGSSGGTAASVAASFATVGLGSDTGNSIRGPSAHTALVGIRSTMGLTSRAGVIPLSYLADVAGPMARTMEDAVAVFQAIVGEDPEDPVTARSHGRAIPNYRASLVPGGLKGARIGILRQAYERANQPPDEEVVKVFTKALDDMKAAGAEIVDQITVERVARTQGAGTCRGFKYDINDYLATRGAKAPVHSLDEIVASGKFDPSVQEPPAAGAGRRHATGTGERRVQGRAGIPRRVRCRAHQSDGRPAARCARLSDVELPAAADRRPADAVRRQQPGLLADVRLPRSHGAHGLHARRATAGRRHVSRTRVG